MSRSAPSPPEILSPEQEVDVTTTLEITFTPARG